MEERAGGGCTIVEAPQNCAPWQHPPCGSATGLPRSAGGGTGGPICGSAVHLMQRQSRMRLQR